MGKREKFQKFIAKSINSITLNNKVYFDPLFFDIFVKRFSYFFNTDSIEMEDK
ncbi:hypothetical protein BH23THE1_BH23THE1_17800 [soil metagenome]